MDENLPDDLRAALSAFDSSTVRYMGFAGLKNGELRDKAEAAGFDILITGDRSVIFEQNFRRRKIALISLTAPHWPLVKNHIPEIAEAISQARPGGFVRVDCGRFTRQRPAETDLSPG